MATKAYDSAIITLLNGDDLYITPLKIKYLREFMVAFDELKKSQSDEESLVNLSKCVRIGMQQYCPSLKTVEDVEDSLDLPTMYKILEFSAGIKLNKDKPELEEIKEKDEDSWKDLDLAKLEAEVFLLGIYKDYEDLETSLSMPELMLTLSQKRELDYQEKKFLAGMQGIDLDKESGKSENKWEEMKARVFSGGKAKDENDILAYQGINAQKAGFGIGMGLGYEDLTKN